MRILNLSYEFPPVGGGGSAVAHGLARRLAASGHQIDVVTMGFAGLPQEDDIEGIHIRRIDCGRRSKSKCTPAEAARYLRRARPVVRELLETMAYDLVHVHFIFPDGILANLEARRAKVPFLITAHGSDVPGFNSKVFFKVAHVLMRPLWRHVVGGARALVVPSRTLAGLVARCDSGAPVRVIPNGIDADRFTPAKKKPQILVATRLLKRKGVQYLLRALANDHPGWPVIIVGSGEYESELLRLNEHLGQPARFVGWLDNQSPEFRALLRESAIYALPSDFENASMSLLEAMAAGAAIISTRNNGCAETLGHAAELVTRGCENEAACIAEIRAAIQRLTQDKAHRETLGREARRRVLEYFSWESVTATYEKVYAEHAAASSPLKLS